MNKSANHHTAAAAVAPSVQHQPAERNRTDIASVSVVASTIMLA